LPLHHCRAIIWFMGQSLKAIVQLSSVVFFMAAFSFWAIPEHPDEIVWVFRFVMPVATALVLWILIRDMRRKETLPDKLREIAADYFERNGFCFAFAPTVDKGVCWMNLFFQNRYQNSCTARVILQQSKSLFRTSRLPLPAIDMDIKCESAAFGVVRIPWPIPAQAQGETVKCDVACDTSYPGGRGKLLRFREGMRAGAAGGGAARAAVTGGLLLVGVISISRPAAVSIKLPVDVMDKLPPSLDMQAEILWRPGPSTGGLVEQATSPA
jgi:hypothetical protein